MSLAAAAAASGPGKTAPKLLRDFFTFDPLKVERNQNILQDHPPPVGEGPQFPAAGPIGTCQHEYTLKHSQCLLPPPDHRPTRGTTYKAALICKKCRLHAEVRLSYEDPDTHDPCPNATYPLHHFQLLDRQEPATHDRIRYAWACSAPGCRAQLRISFRLPRLSVEERELLANPELLKRRYEDARRETPGREDLRLAAPMEALARTRRYLQDALNPAHARRSLPANQKRFIEVFGLYGRDCSELLQKMGFFYSDNEWSLPNPPVLDEQARLKSDGKNQREYLEDVTIELLAWMYKLSSETAVVNPAAAEGWPPAEHEVKRVLAVQGYATYSPMRRIEGGNELRYYFASLGALHDFADELIDFAFERQCLCDPARRPYYFECLQLISEARNTDHLQMKVAMLASQDFVSRRDLFAAYRLLNVPVTDANAIDDARILELFQVRQADLGPRAQEDARQALNKIGTARGSVRLINASRQTIESYDDALTWLGNGVNRETTDEALLAVVGIKVDGSKSQEEIAQKAIAVIAKERKSSYLNNWLTTGRTDGYEMGTNEALRYLGIEDNFEAIDQTILPAVFDSARSDRPGEQTEKAIAVLQKAMEGGSGSSRPLETWPVGLRSHGNTCYLNSLLQYYFSIKPLRDIILDYPSYALDTAKFTEKKERVGQRKISMVEIKGGQRFADDLNRLFERMIKEPSDSVMPEEALVCRAFLEPKDYELLAPNVETKEAASTEKTATPTAPAPVEADKGHDSDASSTTLQGSVEGEDGDTVMVTAPSMLTPPGSPTVEPSKAISELERAPPLPPRKFSTTKQEALTKAESNARQQQDVTEVHDGVMFRLRSGMMPRGMDDSEEQYDELRSLFSIAMTETPVKDGIEGKKKTLLDSSLQLNVPNEAKDIYSALDEIFDLQAYDETAALETYKSIVSLPPLLQINIPRIGFDNVRGAFKSNATIRLVEELYLDRYVDSADPEVLPLRKQCWGWRKQLHALRKEKQVLSKTPVDLDGPAVVTETANYLNRVAEVNGDLAAVGVPPVTLDPELPSALTHDARSQSERLADLNRQLAESADQLPRFEDHPALQKIKYRLAAVFFHRGDYGHGHYWIYIYDFAQQLWRKYNDERVEEFPAAKLEEILAASDWSHGTPTYAVYVRDQEKEAIVQPVCRAPEKKEDEGVKTEAGGEGGKDVEMSTTVAADGEAQAPPLPPKDLPPPPPTIVAGKEEWEAGRREQKDVEW